MNTALFEEKLRGCLTVKTEYFMVLCYNISCYAKQ